MLDNIMVLHFSPTGGTRRAARLLAGAVAAQAGETDLALPQVQAHRFGPEDVVLVAGPVYGGRLPALMVQRLRDCHGGGARAVAAVVYGGRAYEDALLELADVLEAQGFRVIAGAALLAEHSIAHAVAAGRPDGQDEAQLAGFGARIADKLAHGAADTPALPGSRPYRDWAGMPAVPTADGRCTGCGTCAKACPAQAIPADDLRQTDAARCITCMRCVQVCPAGARALPAPVQAAIGQKLAPFAEKRPENELFL